MTYSFNPHDMRVRKAKLQATWRPQFNVLLESTVGILFIASLALLIADKHQGWSLAGLALLIMTWLIWVQRDVQKLSTAQLGTTTQLDQLLPPGIAARYSPDLTPLGLWRLIAQTGEANFLLLRFGLAPADIEANLQNWQVAHIDIWPQTETLAQQLGLERISPSLLVCALFSLNEQLSQYLASRKLSLDDLLEGALWTNRINAQIHATKPLYGGIARDWASGFTPLLSRFGVNISQQVEWSQGRLTQQERTSQLDSLETGLRSATGSVVLIGEPGIGKTALLLGLAEQLLRGAGGGELAHHQIVSLNASTILASAAAPGDIENIVLALLDEAIRAGNIVLALDEAQLFFGQGTGAVNLSQILLPVLQARTLKLVLALTPGDWQRLRATNSAMTSLLTPLVLSEPNQTTTMRILTDRILGIEGEHITTWQALLEAYRLSGRYFDDEAYPGRALKLLEAACNYPDGPFISEQSVRQAVESQFGVKVQTANATETDVLLHLEDKIHERMINQTHAVSVVANALRRARAGVANPGRPVGSFLFLGPTGVGKTELAKSLAALYFGAESNMVRLDMSEYQQNSDEARILASADQNPLGLLPHIRTKPFSVVLFDEIEKAHPNILNLFLQLLDEGNLTDTNGHAVSFKDAIIIATSNAGADEIRQRIEAGQPLGSFQEQFTNNLIDSGTFKPELLNRFDEIVLFRPLNESELAQVVRLMIAGVNQTLESQKIRVELTDEAIAELARAGYDPRLGARPMRRMVTRRVEDTVAKMILRGEVQPGDTITLDINSLTPGSISAGRQ